MTLFYFVKQYANNSTWYDYFKVVQKANLSANYEMIIIFLLHLSSKKGIEIP